MGILPTAAASHPASSAAGVPAAIVEASRGCQSGEAIDRRGRLRSKGGAGRARGQRY